MQPKKMFSDWKSISNVCDLKFKMYFKCILHSVYLCIYFCIYTSKIFWKFYVCFEMLWCCDYIETLTWHDVIQPFPIWVIVKENSAIIHPLHTKGRSIHGLKKACNVTNHNKVHSSIFHMYSANKKLSQMSL